MSDRSIVNAVSGASEPQITPDQKSRSNTAIPALMEQSKIPLMSGISRSWTPPKGGIHRAEQRAEKIGEGMSVSTLVSG